MISKLWLTWARRNSILTSVGILVAFTCAAAIFGEAQLATPQLRGPSTAVPIDLLLIPIFALTIAGSVKPCDHTLESRAAINVRLLRACTFAALLVGTATAVGLLTSRDGSGVHGIQSLAILAGAFAVITRCARFEVAVSIAAAYVGCVLFVGVDPNGGVALWASLLMGGSSVFAGASAIAGACAYIVASQPSN